MSIKRLATQVAGGTGMAAAMAAFTVVPAHAADTWVAIYYSRASTVGNTAYGYANNVPTKEAAMAAANDMCVRNGGTECKMAAVSKNGCAALAVLWSTNGRWHGGAGATIEEAEQDALAQNNGGSIFIEKCST
ncbi:hypothetical protein A5692_07945 [Mycobacterium sp. E342]|nr:hypothetical protein A5692_07945 [Mycobacterium sp. E342]